MKAKDYPLEVRECINGCGNKFKVLPKSKHILCSIWCTPKGKKAKCYDKNPMAVHGIGIPSKYGRPKADSATMKRIRDEEQAKLRELLRSQRLRPNF